nr:hypothetical protein pPsy0479a_00042 [Pseudomonas syringae]
MGLVAASPFLIALIALRVVGLIDPQYLRRIRFARRRLWLNLKYGKPLLLTPFNPQWNEFYGARFSHKRYAPEKKVPLMRYPVHEHMVTLPGNRLVSLIQLKGVPAKPAVMKN